MINSSTCEGGGPWLKIRLGLGLVQGLGSWSWSKVNGHDPNLCLDCRSMMHGQPKWSMVLVLITFSTATNNLRLRPRQLFLLPRQLLRIYLLTVIDGSRMYGCGSRIFVLIIFSMRPATIFSTIWAGLPLRSSELASIWVCKGV